MVQIDVSKNQVRTVKKNFYKPPIELDLSDNRLKKLPAAKSKKKNYIHAINASHNALTKIPPNVNSLTCMTRLDLSNNSLREVCCRPVGYPGEMDPPLLWTVCVCVCVWVWL